MARLSVFVSMRAGIVPDLKFRSRPQSLIRYKEFDWRGMAADALKEIIIGPGRIEV